MNHGCDSCYSGPCGGDVEDSVYSQGSDKVTTEENLAALRLDHCPFHYENNYKVMKVALCILCVLMC